MQHVSHLFDKEAERKHLTALGKAIRFGPSVTIPDWWSLMTNSESHPPTEYALVRWLIDNDYLYFDPEVAEVRPGRIGSELFVSEEHVISGRKVTVLKVTGEGIFQLTVRIIKAFQTTAEDRC